MKGNVYVVDKSKKRLKELHKQFGDKIIPTESEKGRSKKINFLNVIY